MKLFHTLMAAGLLAAATVAPAVAIDISGAGATFPYPIYAKWADAYKRETGVGMNYQSIGSGGGIQQIEIARADKIFPLGGAVRPGPAVSGVIANPGN